MSYPIEYANGAWYAASGPEKGTQVHPRNEDDWCLRCLVYMATNKTTDYTCMDSKFPLPNY